MSIVSSVTKATGGIVTGVGNLVMKMNTQSINTLNNKVESIQGEIDATVVSIRAEFEELLGNVNGSEVNKSIMVIMEKVKNINDKINISFNELTSFMRSQIQKYSTAYDNASVTLKQALSFIDSNL